MQLVTEVARVCSEARIFYLDAKGSANTASWFVTLMEAAGRKVRLFPRDPIDMWRGDASAIENRLLEIIPYAERGPATWYTDIAKNVVHVVCHHPAGPPRSTGELFDRLTMDSLNHAYGAHPSRIASIDSDRVVSVRTRYEAFFSKFGSSFDGEWSWDNTDAAYVALHALALRDNATAAASLLLTDFSHFFAMRKDLRAPCVMVVDEFSSVAEYTDMATKVEQARDFRTAFVLIPQVPSGMGGPDQRDRILGSADTIIVQRQNDPVDLVALAGEKLVIDPSYRDRPDSPLRDRYLRMVSRPKIDPDAIRSLEPGEAWVLHHGAVMKLQIASPSTALIRQMDPSVLVPRIASLESVPPAPSLVVEAAPPFPVSPLPDLPGPPAEAQYADIYREVRHDPC